MPLDIRSIEISGLKDLDEKLEALADEKGENWKRKAMLLSGEKSMNVVLYQSRAYMPVDTGLMKRSLRAKVTYNRPSKAASAINQRTGKVKGNRNHELHGNLTLVKGWNRKSRYPFINEVGVPPQAYIREVRGIAHIVKRVEPRKPILFMHRALATSAPKAVKTFTTSLGLYLDRFTSSQSKAKNPSKKIIRGR